MHTVQFETQNHDIAIRQTRTKIPTQTTISDLTPKHANFHSNGSRSAASFAILWNMGVSFWFHFASTQVRLMGRIFSVLGIVQINAE
jgi:hypothetical protein